MPQLTGDIQLKFQKALSDLKDFRKELRSVTKEPTQVHLRVDADIAKVVRQVKRDLTGLQKLGKQHSIHLKADAEVDQAVQHIRHLKTELSDLGKNPRIRIDVDTRDVERAAKAAKSAEDDVAQFGKALVDDVSRETEAVAKTVTRETERLADRSAKAFERAAERDIKAAQKAADAKERSVERAAARMAREYDKGARAAERAAEREIKAAQKATAALQRDRVANGRGAAGQMADSVGTGATVAGAGILGGLALAVPAAEKFDRALRNVNSIAQLNQKDFQKLRTDVLALTEDKSIRSGPAELAEGLYDIYSVGITGAKAMELLKVASRGAAAGGTEAAVAVDALTGTMNAQIKGATSTRQVMDTLFQTVNDGKVTFPQLASAIGQTLPFLKSGGVSLQEYGAYMADATAKSQSAEYATNNLNNLILKLADPPAEAAKAFDQLGIKYGFAELKGVGFTKKMEEIIKKTKGSEDALKSLFPDQQAFAAAQSIASEKMAGFNKQLVNQTNAMKGAGATARAGAKQNEGLAYQMDKARQDAELLRVEVAEGLAPAIIELVKEVRPLVKGFSDLDTTTKANIIKWTAFAGISLILAGRVKGVVDTVILLQKAYIGMRAFQALAAVEGVAGAGRLGLAMSNLLIGTNAATKGFWALRVAGVGGMAALGIAVAAVVTAVYGFKTAWDGTKDAMKLSDAELRKQWGAWGDIWIGLSKKVETFSNWLSRLGDNPIIDKLLKFSPGLDYVRNNLSTRSAAGDAADAANLADTNRRRKAKGQKPYSPQEWAALQAYAVGTDRVPQDGPAILHKDEIVIPKAESDALRSIFGSRPIQGVTTLVSALKKPQGSAAPRGHLMPAGSGTKLSQFLSPAAINTAGTGVTSLPVAIEVTPESLTRLEKRLANLKTRLEKLNADIRVSEDAEYANRMARAGQKRRRATPDEVQAEINQQLMRRQRVDLNELIAEANRELHQARREAKKQETADERARKTVERENKRRDKELQSARKAEDRAINAGNSRLLNDRATAIAGVNGRFAALGQQRRDVEDDFLFEEKYGPDALKKLQDVRDLVREFEKSDHIKTLRFQGYGKQADAAVQNFALEAADFARLKDELDWLRKSALDANAAVQSLPDALKEWPSLKDQSATALEKITEALDDENASSRQLAESLKDLSPEFLKLVAAGGLSESAANKRALKLDEEADAYERTVDAIDKLKKKISTTRDKEILAGTGIPGLGEDARSLLGDYRQQVRDAEEEGLSMAAKAGLRMNDALEKARQALAKANSDPMLSEEGRRQANADYNTILSTWDQIILSAGRLDELQASKELPDRAKLVLNGVENAFTDSFGAILSQEKSFGESLREGFKKTLHEITLDIIRSRVRSLLVDSFGGFLGGVFGKKNLGPLTGKDAANLGSYWKDNDAALPGPRKIDGSFAIGLDYVPRDGFVAELHRGEKILPAREAALYRAAQSEMQVSRNSSRLPSGASMGASQGSTVIVYEHHGDVVTSSPAEYQRKLQQQAQASTPRIARFETSRGLAVATAQGAVGLGRRRRRG